MGLTLRPNKLERLYLAITFQFSLTFAGNTRSSPKKDASERCSDWVGSGLALKLKDLTGKGFQERSSLLFICLITLTPGETTLNVVYMR